MQSSQTSRLNDFKNNDYCFVLFCFVFWVRTQYESVYYGIIDTRAQKQGSHQPFQNPQAWFFIGSILNQTIYRLTCRREICVFLKYLRLPEWITASWMCQAEISVKCYKLRAVSSMPKTSCSRNWKKHIWIHINWT